MVDVLAEAGVRRIYGVVGDSLNGITDAIRLKKIIEWVHVRHEESGAFAAGAEAHLTQTLAVCAGSCGPGNMHLINGLYDCQRNRVPVLAIESFSLFMLKAVLNGRGDEIIDLARVNLLR